MIDMDKTEPPSPRELVRARRTLQKLHRAIPAAEVELWGGVVEASRMTAVATSYLGMSDDRYQRAWERMLED